MVDILLRRSFLSTNSNTTVQGRTQEMLTGGAQTGRVREGLPLPNIYIFFLLGTVQGEF